MDIKGRRRRLHSHKNYPNMAQPAGENTNYGSLWGAMSRLQHSINTRAITVSRTYVLGSRNDSVLVIE